MGLEQRLIHIEKRLKPQPESPKYEQQGMRFVDLPKETIVEVLGIVRDVGGYQYTLGEEYRAVAGEEELNGLNQLTPGEFYDLMMEQRSAPVMEGNSKETSNEHN